ncbi:hypothetical protein JTE90_021551 [Oedothorax gibbosus]|uniref:Uncharacterized protein n=1 Tax=Oedothorax gibbosus TaxID=931172 RepID=A0AAV6VN93_9ARAC|nr:hypothetical protein JTE90_021551 [Oedothorax gibbosus]
MRLLTILVSSIRERINIPTELKVPNSIPAPDKSICPMTPFLEQLFLFTSSRKDKWSRQIAAPFKTT